MRTKSFVNHSSCLGVLQIGCMVVRRYMLSILRAIMEQICNAQVEQHVLNFNLCVFRVCEWRKRDNCSFVVTKRDHLVRVHKLQVSDRNTTCRVLLVAEAIKGTMPCLYSYLQQHKASIKYNTQPSTRILSPSLQWFYESHDNGPLN